MRALLAAALLVSAPALARDAQMPLNNGLEKVDRPQRWAVGFMLGDPFGLTLKRYLGGANAFDLYAAFAYAPGIRFGGDWLVNLGRAVKAPKVDLDIYVGAGPFIGALEGACWSGFFATSCNGDVYFGGRVPIGAELLLKEVPVTMGVEVAPGVGFAPGHVGFFIFDFLLAARVLL